MVEACRSGVYVLSIMETNRISFARFTDEIEFYLPKNNAVLF